MTDPLVSSAPPKRLPRYRRVENYPKVVIGRPKHNLLMAIARFDYLTAEQLTRLVFGTQVLRYVREHLKELYQSGYVERLYLHPHLPYGSSLAVYCLAKNGQAYVRKQGNAANRIEAPEPYFLRHTIEANDLLIQCHLLERQDSRTQLVNFATERELKRSPGYTRINGKRVSVIPDGWVHLRRAWRGEGEPNNHYICWELDRGTVEQRSFRRKIKHLISWIDSGYTERFGVEGINLAFVTTVSQNRVTEMITWTEQELGDSSYGEFFLFSYYQPERLFFDSIWQQPFSDDYTSLLVPPQ